MGGAERVHLFGPVERAVQASVDLGPSGSPVLVLLLALLANSINNLPAALVTGSARIDVSALDYLRVGTIVTVPAPA